MDKFVIIDGNSLINRAFYALPLLKSNTGEICNAVYGFTTMLIQVITKHKPKYIAVAFDAGKKTFRNDLFTDYKAKRLKMPDELASQLPLLKEMLGMMKIKCIEQPGIEADDIIGSLSKKFKTYNILVSGDKDLFQLIDDNTIVWFTKKGISNVIELDIFNLKKEFDLTPRQVIDLKSLMGDSSDNIPGVAGVGPKTAYSLLNAYESLSGVYENLGKISGSLHDKLVQSKQMAELSYTLATIKTDYPINFELTDFEYDFPFSPDVRMLFKKFDFKTLYLKDEFFKSSMEIEPEVNNQAQSETVTVDSLELFASLVNLIEQNNKCIIHYADNVWHISIDDIKEYVIYKDIENSMQFLSDFGRICKSDKIRKIVFDAKHTKYMLSNYGMVLNNFDDITLLIYLTKQNDRAIDLDNVLKDHNLSKECICNSLLKLFNSSFDAMQKTNQQELYNVELRLVDVLYKMECNGFKIDKNAVYELSEKYNNELKTIEKIIFDLAGFEFNVKSPQQLLNVLFDKLGIAYKGKKSTNIEVLESIYDRHPIVEYIIRYRKISKLVSTYLQGFLPYISEKDGKIHTSFLQTYTSTGRLSSREPNLQNIPVRDEESRLLRKLFVSSFDNGGITSADYNQIELRLMADHSNDQQMIKDFIEGKDIHSVTAGKIFGVPISEITSAMRRTAKAVNFGIIYGISDYGLGKNVGVTRKEAKEFIEKYFNFYPDVKHYMDNCIEFAKQNGYAKTFMNRRRYLPEINSSSYLVRQFSERVAMNMPLQGGASDIIKLAMIEVQKQFENRHLQSKLILQIHDELIVDTHPAEKKIVAQILKDSMEKVVNLKVPLLVDVGFGINWYDSK